MVEAALVTTALLVLLCGGLVLRAGLKFGELRLPRAWGDGWLTAGDPAVETGWRVGVVAMLCAVAAWVLALVYAAYFIGPVMLELAAAGCGYGGMVGVFRVAWNWREVVCDHGARLQDDAFALMLLSLAALVAFWVAMTLEANGGSGLYPLLFSIVAAVATAALGVTHARDEVRVQLFNLVWLGMAGSLALLACAVKQTAVAWTMLVLDIAIVVGLPVIIQWSRLRRTLGWSDGLERDTAGGRTRDGIPGDQLHHK